MRRIHVIAILAAASIAAVLATGLIAQTQISDKICAHLTLCDDPYAACENLDTDDDCSFCDGIGVEVDFGSFCYDYPGLSCPGTIRKKCGRTLTGTCVGIGEERHCVSFTPAAGVCYIYKCPVP